MKLLTLSMCLVMVGILPSCRENIASRGAPAPPEQADSAGERRDGPPVIQLIRSAEDGYRTFLEKHEAARSASKARRALGPDASGPEAYLLATREEEALAARASAAEARLAAWKALQGHSGSAYERKQIAAYLQRYELREEIRLATLAAELYATDPERQEDYQTAQKRLAHYRQKLEKEEAAWELVDKGGWREALAHP